MNSNSEIRVWLVNIVIEIASSVIGGHADVKPILRIVVEGWLEIIYEGICFRVLNVQQSVWKGRVGVNQGWEFYAV